MQQNPELDQAQAAVVALPADAEGVVIGAPGTGKTHALVQRAVRLVASGERAPDEVLVLTPSRQTATRLRDTLGVRLRVATPGAPVRSLGSLAFQIVRAAEVRAGRPAPQLLTGADQDRIVADLLAGDEEDAAAGTPRWPDSLPVAARGSRAFRSELRSLIAECTELALTPDAFAQLGHAHGQPVWVAAASFIRDYRMVIARLRSAHRDASDLLAEAATAVRDAAPGSAGEATLGPLARLRTVLVDDAQELTRGALELVAALRSRGVAVVAFGDPDIGSGAFRGVTAEQFAQLAGLLGTVHVFTDAHRAAPALVRLARAVTQGIGAGGRIEHRSPPGPELDDDGTVSALLAASPYEEADAIAIALRRWHLEDQVPWNRMAVIAHDTRQVAALEAELAAREVPTLAAGVQRPLGRERVVRELLELVALAAVPAAERDPETLASALLSPYGGLDAVGLRRLRAALRHRELAAAGVATAGELLRDAMAHPLQLLDLDMFEARVAERLATTLHRLTEAHERGQSIHELLWIAWDRSRLDGERLADAWRRLATTPGPQAAEAGRSLDALVALFEAAKRAVERGSDAEPLAFIRNLVETDVPEDTLTAADRADTVALFTPAQALGTEFDAVVIAGVQDGVWPNTRLRGGLLETWMLADLVSATRTGHDEPRIAATVDRRRAVLSDELRLFVRALSRATRWLLVTAVDDDDSGPSAVFSFLPAPTRPELLADAGHPLTLRGLVARHRRVLTSVDAPALRAQAAGQLRVLAEAGVPGAAPAQWYGVTAPSSTAPLRDPARAPVPVSPSTIERFEDCGIDWAIRALGGDTRSWSGGLGTILHAAMEEVPDGDLAALQQVVDDRWGELEFEAPWLSAKERVWARTLVGRLHEYLAMFQKVQATRVGAEAEFELAVPLRAGAGADDVIVQDRDAAGDRDEDAGYAVLRGSIDRVEVFVPGTGEVPIARGEPTSSRVMVADLKTSRTPKKYLDRHVVDDAQLAAYQLAVRAGAVPGIEPGELAGARLILLSGLKKGQDYRFALQPAPTAEAADGFVARVIADAEGMASATFTGETDRHCLTERFAVCSMHTIKAVSAS